MKGVERIVTFAEKARRLVLATVMALGGLAGLGMFTFGYGDGASYLRDDPTACANCHVMRSHLDSWVASSHHAVATCNDCHLSHNPIGKWLTKADNGFFHSLAFTTGNYHGTNRISPLYMTIIIYLYPTRHRRQIKKILRSFEHSHIFSVFL